MKKEVICFKKLQRFVTFAPRNITQKIILSGFAMKTANLLIELPKRGVKDLLLS